MASAGSSPRSIVYELQPEQQARVLLPDREADDGVLDESQNENEAVEDGDFLQDYPDETEELDLVHARISSLDGLRLTRFAAHLKRLCLRQNLVSYLDPDVFHKLTELEVLELYDNRLKKVGDALDNLSKLSTLDLSFNLLRAVPDSLSFLRSLHTVYFVQNKITRISGLESCASLRSLELGGNKIRTIEGLDALVNLEELWLGKNKITKLENLSHLKKLKILALQSNRLTKLEGLEELRNLDQLYLSHNGITRLDGLEHNTMLTTLDVGNNFISAIENVSHLSALEEFWINGNQISDLHTLEKQLGPISSLRTLYLEANPCQAADMSGYRRKIMLALPQLKQIDATYVRGA